MKLCPKCEFIYEDDQRFCDMDGEALVDDPRVGVFPTVAVKTGARTARSRVRVFAVPAVAGLALSVLLSLVYYASSAPLDSKFEPTSPKPEANETSLQQQGAPPLDNPSSQPAINPSQTSANPEAAAESVSSDAAELADRAASESTRSQVVPKATDNSLKGGDNGVGISSQLPPLPQLTPLPRVAPLRRLPAAKPEARTPGSTTPKKQRKASGADVRRDHGDASKRSRVGTFLKKTGRILKKPFQF